MGQLKSSVFKNLFEAPQKTFEVSFSRTRAIVDDDEEEEGSDMMQEGSSRHHHSEFKTLSIVRVLSALLLLKFATLQWLE